MRPAASRSEDISCGFPFLAVSVVQTTYEVHWITWLHASRWNGLIKDCRVSRFAGNRPKDLFRRAALTALFCDFAEGAFDARGGV
jgi:hypothetical protein